MTIPMSLLVRWLLRALLSGDWALFDVKTNKTFPDKQARRHCCTCQQNRPQRTLNTSRAFRAFNSHNSGSPSSGGIFNSRKSPSRSSNTTESRAMSRWPAWRGRAQTMRTSSGSSFRMTTTSTWLSPSNWCPFTSRSSSPASKRLLCPTGPSGNMDLVEQFSRT